MITKNLWNKKDEENFFKESLKSFASPEKLFYKTEGNKFISYWPKKYKGKKTTNQSRNSLIGNYTEKWVKDLFQEIIEDNNLFVIQNCICDEIGLNKKSPADVAITNKNSVECKPKNIKLILEVKMSIVNNWEYKNNKLIYLGDYTTHTGTPSILRSDSMLKAIGKSISIRVSSNNSSTIPIIIIGNTPIQETYYEKVDYLKNAGIIQGFWSMNPNPLDNKDTIKKTEKEGFYRFDNIKELSIKTNNILSDDLNFFSSMTSKKNLGKIIEISNKEKTPENKAEKFLKMLRGDCNGKIH